MSLLGHIWGIKRPPLPELYWGSQKNGVVVNMHQIKMHHFEFDLISIVYEVKSPTPYMGLHPPHPLLQFTSYKFASFNKNIALHGILVLNKITYPISMCSVCGVQRYNTIWVSPFHQSSYHTITTRQT